MRRQLIATALATMPNRMLPTGPALAPPGKRERNKLANRAAILDAARKCFLKMGYDAVTVRDVVRKSSLAAGTFYNYFTDKDALFKALLECRINEVNEAMRALRKRATTIEGFIYGAYYALFSKIAEDPAFFRLILRNEHAVRTIFEDTVMGVPMSTLKDDFREAVVAGLLPEVNIDLLAAACYGIGFELGRIVAHSKKPDAEATALFATQLMTSGIPAFGIHKTASARRGMKGDVSVRGSLP